MVCRLLGHGKQPDSDDCMRQTDRYKASAVKAASCVTLALLRCHSVHGAGRGGVEFALRVVVAIKPSLLRCCRKFSTSNSDDGGEIGGRLAAKAI